eukprot:4791234-Ditylum_brightwellii.AAC.1
MLENTTQYFPTCVESETCAYPVQHCQKQLFLLRLLWLKDFLWVKLLRQESQVPGAYDDFCIEVGTPNELLTDNSKVQDGLKLTEVNH